MKNLSNLISQHFFLSLTSLWEAKQGISHSISFFLIIIDLEVISRELLGLADLTKAQTLYINEPTDVIIVSKD